MTCNGLLPRQPHAVFDDHTGNRFQCFYRSGLVDKIESPHSAANERIVTMVY